MLLGGRRSRPACVEPQEHADDIRTRHGPEASLEGTRGVLLLFQRTAMQRLSGRYPLGGQVRWVAGDLRIWQQAGSSIAVCAGFGIGAPATAIVLEQLIALGARSIIAIGTAGTLQPHLTAGDTVLCERAVRGEGVSGHYWEPERYAYPSSRLTRLMENEFRANSCDVHLGSSWTTDALYRETREQADRYANENILTVEMEAAALFAVSRYREAECAASFVVSDSLVRGERRPRRSDLIAGALDVAVNTAIAVLLAT
jgi:uridine phosphorylase